MNPTSGSTRRFAIALSFPGQHRRLVRIVAHRLADVLNKSKVFFDEWYRSELHGTDLDLKLKRIYRDDSELIVPFFSEHYTKQWCQIEWHAIRAVLAERRKSDAVVPVHVDGTKIDGWETVDFGIRKGRMSGRQVADALIDVYERRINRVERPEVAGKIIPFELAAATSKSPSRRAILRAIERACAEGVLRDSLVAQIAISVFNEETCCDLAPNVDLNWLVTGIRLSDEYFVRVQGSAGHRDWQRNFAETCTPTIVAMTRSLKRSGDAQAMIIHFCTALATRLRVSLIWPVNPDDYNDLANAIYAACICANNLEDDDVLVALKGLVVIGPK